MSGEDDAGFDDVMPVKKQPAAAAKPKSDAVIELSIAETMNLLEPDMRLTAASEFMAMTAEETDAFKSEVCEPLAKRLSNLVICTSQTDSDASSVYEPDPGVLCIPYDTVVIADTQASVHYEPGVPPEVPAELLMWKKQTLAEGKKLKSPAAQKCFGTAVQRIGHRVLLGNYDILGGIVTWPGACPKDAEPEKLRVSKAADVDFSVVTSIDYDDMPHTAVVFAAWNADEPVARTAVVNLVKISLADYIACLVKAKEEFDEALKQNAQKKVSSISDRKKAKISETIAERLRIAKSFSTLADAADGENADDTDEQVVASRYVLERRGVKRGKYNPHKLLLTLHVYSMVRPELEAFNPVVNSIIGTEYVPIDENTPDDIKESVLKLLPQKKRILQAIDAKNNIAWICISFATVDPESQQMARSKVLVATPIISYRRYSYERINGNCKELFKTKAGAPPVAGSTPIKSPAPSSTKKAVPAPSKEEVVEAVSAKATAKAIASALPQNGVKRKAPGNVKFAGDEADEDEDEEEEVKPKPKKKAVAAVAAAAPPPPPASQPIADEDEDEVEQQPAQQPPPPKKKAASKKKANGTAIAAELEEDLPPADTPQQWMANIEKMRIHLSDEKAPAKKKKPAAPKQEDEKPAKSAEEDGDDDPQNEEEEAEPEPQEKPVAKKAAAAAAPTKKAAPVLDEAEEKPKKTAKAPAAAVPAENNNSNSKKRSHDEASTVDTQQKSEGTMSELVTQELLTLKEPQAKFLAALAKNAKKFSNGDEAKRFGELAEYDGAEMTDEMKAWIVHGLHILNYIGATQAVVELEQQRAAALAAKAAAEAKAAAAAEAKAKAEQAKKKGKPAPVSKAALDDLDL